jgi:hypothetical protein
MHYVLVQNAAFDGWQARLLILSPPGGSVSQTIVFRDEEIGDILRTKHREKVMFLSNYSVERNTTVSSVFPTKYTPDCVVAEYYSMVCETLPPGGLRISHLLYALGQIVRISYALVQLKSFNKLLDIY